MEMATMDSFSLKHKCHHQVAVMLRLVCDNPAHMVHIQVNIMFLTHSLITDLSLMVVQVAHNTLLVQYLVQSPLRAQAVNNDCHSPHILIQVVVLDHLHNILLVTLHLTHLVNNNDLMTHPVPVHLMILIDQSMIHHPVFKPDLNIVAQTVFRFKIHGPGTTTVTT